MQTLEHVQLCDECEGWGVNRMPVTRRGKTALEDYGKCTVCQGAGRLVWRVEPYWGSESAKAAKAGTGTQAGGEDPV